MFREQGFEILQGVVSSEECSVLDSELKRLHVVGAGTRNLLDASWCVSLAEKVRRFPGVAQLFSMSHVVVQCTYFEKSQEKNWLVPFHQDLSIPVAERVDHPSLRGWSEKEGTVYVQPPLAVLENMIAVRLHLDRCGAEDGPLKVVPGSHAFGILGAEAGADVRSCRQEVACLVPSGAAVVMRPLIFHASSKATGKSLRRVLHFLFGPRELPYGLRWQIAV